MKIVDTYKSRYAKLDSFGIDKVGIRDSFWTPKISLNSRVSIPHQFNECERTHRIDNFRIAAGLKKGKHIGIHFNDSDLHKLSEAASLDLAINTNDVSKKKLEDFITLAGKAQQKDGYLYTSHQINKKKRWSNLFGDHEIYSAGHMIQAAVAHHRVTGRDNYLKIAEKWATCAIKYFGPKKHRGTCGHPEAEMALVELYRETGKKEYLDLAEFFIDERGKKPLLFGGNIYMQDHLPIRKQKTVAGHSVRQLYLCSGEADLYAEKGDKRMLSALKAQWNNFANKKMYITGAAGSNYDYESFEEEYSLANRAYAETCASIASFMWNWRMFLIEPSAKYTDLMETVMYNGIISGMSLDGKKYFYANPLEHKGDSYFKKIGANTRTTKHWDGCACCPPNVARFFSYFRGSIYAQSKKAPGLFVNFYVSGTSKLNIAGTPVEINQSTNYPWNGNINIKIEPAFASKFVVNLRIPGWARSAKVSVNGKPVKKPKPGSYLTVDRIWESGDLVTISLPMPVEKIRSNPMVSVNAGSIALKRGPVVYCVESADFGKNDVYNVVLPLKSKLRAVHKPKFLGGVTVLKGKALLKNDIKELYTLAEKEHFKTVSFTAIPYFVWANRKPGKMKVWVEGR